MRRLTCFLVGILWLLNATLSAQDLIYTISAEKISCKVTELDEFRAIYQQGERIDSIYLINVYLIHYANGRIERYAIIEEEVSNVKYKRLDPKKGNQIAMLCNALALVNSDITGLIEYRFKNPSYAIGILGAYNFNTRASIFNRHIQPLPDSKKLFDAGIYLSGKIPINTSKYSFLYGFLAKYTAFYYTSYSSAKVNTSNGSYLSSIPYTRKDRQLAYLPFLGYERQISETLFLRSMFAFGIFAMSEQYSKDFYKQPRQTGSFFGTDKRLFSKAYLGLCIGWEL